LPERWAGRLSVMRSLGLWGIVAGVAAAVGARLAAGRARAGTAALGEAVFDVVAILASWPPLLYVTITRYWGFYRHHLYLGVPLVVFLAGWALDRRTDGAVTSDPGTRGGVAREARRAGLLLLMPWIAFQIADAMGCLVLDYRYPFSDTKAVARLLADRAHVVADADWRSSGILFWRPDVTMRSASWHGQRFRYPLPDAARGQVVPIGPLLQEECREAPDRTYFVGVGASLGALAPCAKRLDFVKMPFETQPFTWETLDVFPMDCACAASKR
jgi:hypothetical protein